MTIISLPMLTSPLPILVECLSCKATATWLGQPDLFELAAETEGWERDAAGLWLCPRCAKYE